MTKKKAVTLGVFTFLPILYYFVFISFFFLIYTSINNEQNQFTTIFLVIFPIHFAMMINIIILLVIYIKDVFKNINIEESKRTLWALVLFFGNMIAMPIYWYKNIWVPLKAEGRIINNNPV